MSSMYSPNGNVPTLPCQRCGMQLPLTMPQCSRCGYNNAPSPLSSPQANTNTFSPQAQTPSNTFQGSNQPSTSTRLSQFLGPQWGQPPVSGRLSNGHSPSGPLQPFSTLGGPTQSQPLRPSGNSGPLAPQPTFGTASQPLNPNAYNTTQSQISPSNNYYGSSAPQQFYPTEASPFTRVGFQPSAGSRDGFQRPDFTQPPEEEQRPRPKRGLIIGIVILVIVLLGGGSLGALYLLHKPSAPTTSITATVAPSPTRVLKGTPLFKDTFANNTNNWDTTSSAGQYSAKVGGGFLILEDDQRNLLPEPLPVNKTYSNFVLTIDAELSKGDQINGYGIYIRGALNQNSNLATYYRFELYGDGTYGIVKGVVDATGNSTRTTLVDATQTTNPAIQIEGTINHIMLIANGPKMTLMVNGQTLKVISDPSYASGIIALFVANSSIAAAGAQATFSHLTIYPPQP